MGKLSIIVAIAANNAIGKDNDLLWHIPEDLKRFKRLTSGHAVIMGRNTYFSLPRRPLPNRTNVVLTLDQEELIEGCVMARSIEEARRLTADDPEAFVMGGGEVYRQFLPLADKLYITRVHRDFEADTFFPEIEETQWKLIEKEDREENANLGFSFSYLTYVRV